MCVVCNLSPLDARVGNPGGSPQLSRRSFALSAVAALACAPALTSPATAAQPLPTGLVAPPLRLSASSRDKNMVALTLDACGGKFDMRIATALVEHNIKATIFATALWIAGNPGNLAFLLARRDLFVIENHGNRHHAPVLSPTPVFGVPTVGDAAGLRAEVLGGAAAIKGATGRQPRWYRGATALYSPQAITDIAAMGFSIGGFSVNGDQGASLSAAGAARMVASAQPGDVIIGHINQPGRTAGAGIVEGIKALRDRGMVFAHLEQPGLDGPLAALR